MTLEEIEKRLDEIRNESGYNGNAHAMADKLHEDYLRFLADNGDECAKLVITTRDMDFPRWYE